MYRIRDWDVYYETSETRKWKTLKWVPLRVKLDGRNYRRLMKLKKGPQIFGCWCALLEAATKCDPRGDFVDGSGNVYGVDDLVLVTEMPQHLVAETLTLLSTPPFDWVITASAEESPASAGESSASASLNKIEQDRIELQIEQDTERRSFLFGELWKDYPRKDGRIAALGHFNASVLTEQDEADIRTALTNYKAEKDGIERQYLKAGSTWFYNWRDFIIPDPLIEHAKVTAEYAAEREQKAAPPQETEEMKQERESETRRRAEETKNYMEEMRQAVKDGTATVIQIELVRISDRMAEDDSADGTAVEKDGG